MQRSSRTIAPPLPPAHSIAFEKFARAIKSMAISLD